MTMVSPECTLLTAFCRSVTLLTQTVLGPGLGGGPSDGAADGRAGVSRSSRTSTRGTNALLGVFFMVALPCSIKFGGGIERRRIEKVGCYGGRAVQRAFSIGPLTPLVSKYILTTTRRSA